MNRSGAGSPEYPRPWRSLRKKSHSSNDVAASSLDRNGRGALVSLNSVTLISEFYSLFGGYFHSQTSHRRAGRAKRLASTFSTGFFIGCGGRWAFHCHRVVDPSLERVVQNGPLDSLTWRDVAMTTNVSLNDPLTAWRNPPRKTRQGNVRNRVVVNNEGGSNDTQR